MLLEVLNDCSGLKLLLSEYDAEIINVWKFSASCWILVVLLQGYKVQGH